MCLLCRNYPSIVAGPAPRGAFVAFIGRRQSHGRPRFCWRGHDSDEELQDAIDRLIRGERDPEAMRKAYERMDQMREELRARIGTVEMAVDLIRDARDP